MALLKAFVCQVLLLGLYKVFLEKVVEEHLVPDELTRNCLVGFVCLLCFGIQLYTDKADEDDATDEDQKVKLKSRGSTGAQKFELAEKYFTEDGVTKIIGSYESCYSLNAELSSQIATGRKQFPEERQEVDSKEVSRAETKQVSGLFPNVGTFSESSTNIPSTTNEAASTYQDSFEQNTRSFPVLNGTSKESMCEDSEEESIEIDQFVPKESAGKDKKSVSHKVEATKLEEVTTAALESECLSSNGMPTLSSQDSGSSINGSESESNMINGIEIDQFVSKEATEHILLKVEATKLEEVTTAALESECLSSNGMPTLSSQDSGSSINGAESEPNIINGPVEESSNEANEMSSNTTEKLESKKLTEENEVGQKVYTYSKDASESNEFANYNIPERYCSRPTSSKVEPNTPNKNNAETSPALSSRRRKLSQNVVVTSVNIDISFLYAFY